MPLENVTSARERHTGVTRSVPADAPVLTAPESSGAAAPAAGSRTPRDRDPGADTVELVVCPRCYASGRDPEYFPKAPPDALNCRRCLGARVVPIDELSLADHDAFRVITEHWRRSREPGGRPWDPARSFAPLPAGTYRGTCRHAFRGEEPPLVLGGQGRSARQVEDDASGVLVVWALVAVAFVVACLVAGGLA